jgi:hypothetical protein
MYMGGKRNHKVRLLSEAGAKGPAGEIYAEIKQSFGLPFVPSLFQAFAAYPLFLELHWQALKPIISSAQFFSLADRLRADAYTRVHSYFEVPDLCAPLNGMKFSDAAKMELTIVVEMFHYQEVLELLIAAAQLQAFESKLGEARAGTPAPQDRPAWEFTPILIEEQTATPRVRKIFEAVMHSHALPFVNLAYRAFARWPDFLSLYWETLAPMLDSPVYSASDHSLRQTAWAFAREFPVPLELTLEQLVEAGLDPEEVSSLARLTEMFVKALSGITLNVAMAKIGVEGGTRKGQLQPAPQAAPAPGKPRAA